VKVDAFTELVAGFNFHCDNREWISINAKSLCEG
jgi:hypothetical protein